jgi:hypothetical protein
MDPKAHRKSFPNENPKEATKEARQQKRKFF